MWSFVFVDVVTANVVTWKIVEGNGISLGDFHDQQMSLMFSATRYTVFVYGIDEFLYWRFATGLSSLGCTNCTKKVVTNTHSGNNNIT